MVDGRAAAQAEGFLDLALGNSAVPQSAERWRTTSALGHHRPEGQRPQDKRAPARCTRMSLGARRRPYLGPTADLGAACRRPGLGMWGLLVPLGLTVDRCRTAAGPLLQPPALLLASSKVTRINGRLHTVHIWSAPFLCIRMHRGHVTCAPSTCTGRHSTIARYSISRPVARQSYPAPALPTGHGGPNRMMCRPETHNYVNAPTPAAPPPARAKRKHETAKKQKQSISSPAIIHGLKDTQAWLRRPGQDAARLAPATSCRQLHLLLSNPRETLACIDDLQPSPALSSRESVKA